MKLILDQLKAAESQNNIFGAITAIAKADELGMTSERLSESRTRVRDFLIKQIQDYKIPEAKVEQVGLFLLFSP